MAKKNDSFYFDAFRESAECACRAANLLSDVMHDYDPQQLREHMDTMHEIEQAADTVRHNIMDELVSAFITPFEREDIADLSHILDNVTDRIDGTLQRLYYDNVTEIRPDALGMVDMVAKSCKRMAKLIDELPRFKRSKKLRKLVFDVNVIETDADTLFVDAMRTLHTDGTDVMQVFAWHEVYTNLELCTDDCEHVADAVDHIVMKNS